MTIVATLKAAESRSAGVAHSIASIPLSKLVLWEGNVRRTNPAQSLEELTASIAAHGVLQSLVVSKTNRGKYAVIAGRGDRRFSAERIEAQRLGGARTPQRRAAKLATSCRSASSA